MSEGLWARPKEEVWHNLAISCYHLESSGDIPITVSGTIRMLTGGRITFGKTDKLDMKLAMKWLIINGAIHY